jgi:sigma-B regulation protein RsbU (phosphoserine phosphatase)
MEIAQRLQVSMLPRTVQIPGVELAAAMVPASEVGGDYYDVIPAADGAWIGIGDVAGHGVQAGVIMLMVQSTMNAIVGARPDAAPREVLGLLNRVLYGNIRERLQTDEHVTLSLLRFRRDGRVVFAGAHEDMVVCRGGDAPCDVIATPGPWMGAVRDVTGSLADGVVTLGAGDLLVLFSDGITEARSPAGDRFGIERLCAEIERRRAEAPDRIRAAVFSAVTSFTGPAPQEDDMTLLVLRYLGSGAAAGGSKSRP